MGRIIFVLVIYQNGKDAGICVYDNAFLNINFISSTVKLNHYLASTLLVHRCTYFADVCLLHRVPSFLPALMVNLLL